MGIHIIKMPDIGEGIAEVELVGWHVAVGDTVSEDQPLADVMTDKATVEIPSPVNGTVVALGGTVGTVMAVGGELIRLEVEGAGNQRGAKENAPAGAASHASGAVAPDASIAPKASQGSDVAPASGASSEAPIASDMLAASGAAAGSPAPQVQQVPGRDQARLAPTTVADRPRTATTQTGPDTHPFTPREAGERPQASPAVRKRAWDLGIELRFVRGTGEASRILHEDLDAFLQGKGHAADAATTRGGYRTRHDEEQIPVIGLRRKIAQKMQEAKRRIPHFSYVEEIDVTDLESLRADLNLKWGQTRGRLTILPLLARAMVIALRDFPQINARYDDEAGVVTRHGAVHIGIATQSDAGLMVPVLEHAEARDVWDISAEITRLAQAVRSGRAGRNELSGSTITITSLGALGGIVTTPVINHPEVGIVGVNRIVERPMYRQGAVVARKLMNLSSSFDHRVVDGMDAAQFIQAVRGLLEQPAMLFVE